MSRENHTLPGTGAGQQSLDDVQGEAGDAELDPCPSCGGENTEGGPEVCPSCEDRQAAARDHDGPPGDPAGAGRVPPHGNTSR